MITHEAILSSSDDMTSFTYGDVTIRFKTPANLVRYVNVKEWDSGYIVCDALYRDAPEPEEEYIDLVPILRNLYFEPAAFLQDIQKVRIEYDDQHIQLQ